MVKNGRRVATKFFMQLGLIEYIDSYVIHFFYPTHTEQATGPKSKNFAKNVTFSTISPTPLCNLANFMADYKSPSLPLFGNVWQVTDNLDVSRKRKPNLASKQLGQPILAKSRRDVWEPKMCQ